MINTSELAERYSATLQAYLSRGDEQALQEAYKLGREALEAHIGPLVLFSLHRDIVAQLPPQELAGDEFVRRATTVFVEALAPFQMSIGSFDEANARLNELMEILQRHTEELEPFRVRPGVRPGSPEVHELEALVKRHAHEIDEVRKRLEGSEQAGDTRRRLSGCSVRGSRSPSR